MLGPRGDIVDDGGHVRDGYGLEPGTWVLIRPDGYIGAIVCVPMSGRPSTAILSTLRSERPLIERRDDRC